MSDAVTLVAGVRRTRRRRTGLANGLVLAALLVALAFRVLGGDYTITAPDFVRILAGADLPGASFVLMESKLPRAVLGVLVGVAFGLGGTVFQTALRNPLASPDVIGISAGASAAACFAIIGLGLSGLAVSAVAVVGALAVAAAIRLGAGSGNAFRLVLVGVALAALLTSVVQHLLSRANVFDLQAALLWITGSLNQTTWPTIGRFAVVLAVLVALTAAVSPRLRTAELGDDTAAGLGEPSARQRPVLVLAVLLVATATATAGPVAFVALLSGPIARRLNRGRLTLTGSALVGALVVVASDHVAAYALPDANLPVGVVTGALGAPFLLWLLTRTGAPGRSTT